MNFNNQNESKDLENILLKVKFNKEINDLYYSMEEGDLLKDIEEELKEKESMKISLLIDSSEDPKEILTALGAADIEDLNKIAAEDRIFKRIIKMLGEKNLKWEIRQNKIRDKAVRGHILQLNIYK